MKKKDPNFPLQINAKDETKIFSSLKPLKESKDEIKISNEKRGSLNLKEGSVVKGRVHEFSDNIARQLEEKKLREFFFTQFEDLERQAHISSKSELSSSLNSKKHLRLKKVNLVRNGYTHSPHHPQNKELLGSLKSLEK